MNSIKLPFRSFFLLTCIFLFFISCAKSNHDSLVIPNPENDGIDIVKNRISDIVWKQSFRYCKVSIDEKPIRDDEGNLYLQSIDYKSEIPSEWPVIGHLEYIMAYLRSIGKEQLKNDVEAQKTVIGLLDFWIQHDFRNNNWYWNQIGVPYDLADICIMFGDYLDKTRLEKIDEILNRGTYGKGQSINEIKPESNSTDWMDISIKHAVLFRNEELLETYADKLNELIDYGPFKESGIQTDYSYFCYSALASGGSYSAVYTRNISYFISLLYGTDFQLKEEKIKLFVDFLLDGQRFFNRGYGAPHFSIARSAAYANGGGAFYESLSKLVNLGGIYRHKELLDYYKSFNDFSYIKPEIKCFSVPGVIINSSVDSYIGVRGCMDGYSMTDVQNQEGVLNFNLSYGSNTCYMYYGDEYSSIGAVYDFSMFPGTTTYYQNDEELLLKWKNEYNQTWGHDDFYKSPYSNCQLKCDDVLKAGVLITELHNNGIDGKNAFITFGSSLYVLGTGFCAAVNNSKDIITTIDQCKTDEIDFDNVNIRKFESISNRMFTYTNLSDVDMICNKRNKEGSYKRTNLNSGDDKETGKIFCCYYNWGKSLDDISYAYKVTGNNSKESNDLNVVSISNSEACQLIEFDNGTIIGYSYSTFNYQDNNGKVYSIAPGFVFLKN